MRLPAIAYLGLSIGALFGAIGIAMSDYGTPDTSDIMTDRAWRSPNDRIYAIQNETIKAWKEIYAETTEGRQSQTLKADDNPITISGNVEQLKNLRVANTYSLFVTSNGHDKILEIKRPWLKFGDSCVIRLTDAEWATLVKAYPTSVQNADSSQAVTFFGSFVP